MPPGVTANLTADTALLQKAFRNDAPIVIHELNPWSYIAGLRDDLRPPIDVGQAAV
jgi:hypothetical protein